MTPNKFNRKYLKPIGWIISFIFFGSIIIILLMPNTDNTSISRKSKANMLCLQAKIYQKNVEDSYLKNKNFSETENSYTESNLKIYISSTGRIELIQTLEDNTRLKLILVPKIIDMKILWDINGDPPNLFKNNCRLN